MRRPGKFTGTAASQCDVNFAPSVPPLMAAAAMASVRRDVAWVLVISATWRFATVGLTALLATLSAPYDSSASIDPSVVVGDQGPWDALVLRLLGPLSHWDGVFYTHIAQHGYTYEMFHAFFPGLPLCMGVVASAIDAVFQGVLPLSRRSLLLLAGVLVT